jgi:hypothetical protein
MFGWLFEDDGCSDGHHHFTSFTPLPHHRILPGVPRGSYYDLEQKHKATCAHEGCTKTREKWETVRTIGTGDLTTLKEGGNIVPDIDPEPNYGTEDGD